MVSVFVKSVCRSVLSVVKPWPIIPLFLSSHARGIPTIMVGMLIVLENPSSVIEVMTRTFIALDGPPKASEGISVIVKGYTPTRTVPKISCPVNVPPKPLDLVAVCVISVHGDYC